MTFGREIDDTDISSGALGCSQEGRQEHFRQQCMTDVVGAELNLVAFFRGSRRNGHDAGIVDQHVEVIRCRLKQVRSRLDRGKGGEIERQESDGRSRDGGLDVSDGHFRLGSGTSSQVNFGGFVLCKLEDCLFAQSRVSWWIPSVQYRSASRKSIHTTSHQNHLPREVWDIVVGAEILAGEHLPPSVVCRVEILKEEVTLYGWKHFCEQQFVCVLELPVMVVLNGKSVIASVRKARGICTLAFAAPG